MTSNEAKEYYSKFETYTASPITENPLLSQLDPTTLIAWFRCDSCASCKWREEVIDKDSNPDHDVFFCSRMHTEHTIIDMVSYLGYSKEGRISDRTPRFEGNE